MVTSYLMVRNFTGTALDNQDTDDDGLSDYDEVRLVFMEETTLAPVH